MLVVNPNYRLKTEFAAIEPPLWAGLCASYLGADILDAEAEDLTVEDTELAIRLSRQRDILIVVMGNNPSVSSTPKMPVAEALADRIKDLNVSFTGLHPIAVNYDRFPLIRKPFEGYPVMPWSKLPMHLYRAHNWHCLDGSSRKPYASIYTSLGCPFNCWFCNIHTLYGGRQIQLRPIDDVLKEIEVLATHYKVRNIKFWDELFAFREDRVINICHGIRGYNLNIWAYARVDTTTEKMLKAMKDAGINWLAYGFESIADPKFKGVERAIQMTRDAGINIIANFMFGLPNVSAETDWNTLRWAKEQLFEYANFYEARPYPGSAWYNSIRPILSWEQYDQYGNNHRSFRDDAFREYFTNPAYLEMIQNKFGEQSVYHIKSMLQWR